MSCNNLAQIRAEATGRWADILRTAGIAPEYLNPRKHRSCPGCGGKDRYRFTDWQGSGGYICNQCSPEGGSGFDLIMLCTGCSFPEALQKVAYILGLSDTDSPITYRENNRASVKKPPADKKAKLEKLLRATIPCTQSPAVTEYLSRRGLSLSEDSLQHLYAHPAVPYWYIHRDKPQLLDYFPTMVASALTNNGELAGLHLTFLQKRGGYWQKLQRNHPDTGEPLPAKKMQSRYPGSFKGASVPLSPAGNALAVCEGIETALAAHQLFRLPVCAVLSAWGMRHFIPPAQTQDLYIIADNDLSNTGQAAAKALARVVVMAGKNAFVWTPPVAGDDALDELNRRQGENLCTN